MKKIKKLKKCQEDNFKEEEYEEKYEVHSEPGLKLKVKLKGICTEATNEDRRSYQEAKGSYKEAH